MAKREKKLTKEQQKFYAPAEAAEILGVATNTLRRWVYDGKVRAFKDKLTGRVLISELEIERLQEDRYEEYHK